MTSAETNAGDIAAPLSGTHVPRLIAELSWEGPRISAYRDGGVGKENVLTAEVFLALDYLPRRAFLGGVVAAASGADDTRSTLVDQIEDATIGLLPGDIILGSSGRRRSRQVIVQPDGLIDTRSVASVLEVKRIRSSSFQPEQLAREYLVAHARAQARSPLLLLVIPDDPPVKVTGAGRMSVSDAITGQIAAVAGRCGLPIPDAGLLSAQIENSVAWITWPQLRSAVTAADAELTVDDPSIAAALRRLVDSLIHAIDRHS